MRLASKLFGDKCTGFVQNPCGKGSFEHDSKMTAVLILKVLIMTDVNVNVDGWFRRISKKRKECGVVQRFSEVSRFSEARFEGVP